MPGASGLLVPLSVVLVHNDVLELSKLNPLTVVLLAHALKNIAPASKANAAMSAF